VRHLVAVLLLGSVPVLAQNRGVIVTQRVPAGMAYHRVWAVTPLTGTGKIGDPVRPMFLPAPTSFTGKPGQAAIPNDRSGVLGYQMQLSDDGKLALVEYVFATPTSFQDVLKQEAASRGIAVSAVAGKPASAPGLAASSAAQTALEVAVPGLKLFERGKATEAQILAEFRRHKANFAFNAGSVRPQ